MASGDHDSENQKVHELRLQIHLAIFNILSVLHLQMQQILGSLGLGETVIAKFRDKNVIQY